MYCYLVKIYGAIYKGVPTRDSITHSDGNGLENPKSAILHWPSCIRILAGLRSRWIKLLLTISFSPFAIYFIILIAWSSSKIFFSDKYYFKSGPLQYS